MVQRILVPLDGSQCAEQAIPVAARIARASGAAVVLLRVVTSPIDFEWYRIASAETMEQAVEDDFAAAIDYLATIAQSRELAGIETKTQVLLGTAASLIMPVARAYRAGLIVMSSHGERGFQRWAVGSVTHTVACHSPIPILVVREGAGGPSNLHPEGMRPVRVLVPLDGSPLAEQTIAPAARLSRALSAPLRGELHLLRVLPLSVMQDDHAQESAIAARAQAVAEAKSYLQTVAQRTRAGNESDATEPTLQVTSSVIIDTDVAGAIIRRAENGDEREGMDAEADTEGCDLIALAAHSRGRIERWVLGSVTERVLKGTRLPLLIVRPQRGEDKHDLGKEAKVSSSLLPH